MMKSLKQIVAGLLLMTVFALEAQVSLTVDATVMEDPISRHLFGKFTEHLGKNVYLGAWAQLVENPEFVSVDAWPPRQNGTYTIQSSLERAGKEFGLKRLVEDAANGIAAYWEGSGNIRGRLLKEGNWDFQKIYPGAEAGYIQTGIYPPLHRTSKYELSLKARSDKASAVVIQVLDAHGNLLGEKRITLTKEWEDHEAVLELDASAHTPGDPYLLRLDFSAGGELEVARILVFPSDHMDGWEPEVIALVKDAKLPLLRYPGGNFVSGYHWKDGIGPLDERLVLPNPAWPIMEWNHVGNDEWINFCRLTGAEPMICVNAGNGRPEQAVDWIRYCNGGRDTDMGKLREAGGNAEPFNVRIWEVGNELCGPWQIGFTNGTGYAGRYNMFATAMLEEDPDLKLVANGMIRVLEGDGVILDRGENTTWNRELVGRNGELVRSISVHSLVGGYLHDPADPVEVWKGLLAFSHNYLDFLDEMVSEPMRSEGLKPRVSITELMDWPHHPTLPNVTSISGALWYSAIINQCIRSGGLVDLVTHSALLNHGGGLRKDHGIVFTDPVHWANHMYGSQSGILPLRVESNSPTFNANGEFIVKGKDIPVVDAVALLDESGESCTVFLSNRDVEKTLEVNLLLEGFAGGKTAEMMQIKSDRLDIRNSWQEPENVYPEWGSVKVRKGKTKLELPPLSLTRIVYETEN